MSEETTETVETEESTETVETTEGDATESDISESKESVEETESTEGDIPDVPYDRFKEVILERNSLRERTQQLKDSITKLRETPNKEATTDTIGSDDADSLDAVIKERAAAGNPVTYEELGELYFDKFQSMQQERDRRAQEQVDKEIKSLYDSELVKTKDEENAVLNFAVKKSEELGQQIPLQVAAQWLNDSKKTSNESKEVSSKTQSSRKSDGASKPEKNYQRDVKGKDLDEIIMDAKSGLDK